MTRMPTILSMALAVASSAIVAPVQAMTDAELHTIVAKRLRGDRTGACFAVARIEETVSRAYVCADDQDPSARIDANTAFEIGSVSKPMMAALLAGLIREGKAALDDPLSAYLPEGSVVPDFEGKPILLRHVVTHTSGLPAIPEGAFDPENPYARVAEGPLLKALAGTRLDRAPGTKFEYSNFAAMLLSYAISRRAGDDFETLLEQRVLAPLEMRSSYVNRKPDGVKAATGHLPNGHITPAWTFPAEFAGVGGVRATLDDMVRYVQGQFGAAPTPLDADLRATHAAVANDAQAPMAMHWLRANLNGREFITHEGGTGGFSSFVAFDPARRTGVVILSDTALHSLGGLSSVGLHLLDPKAPLGKPRKAVKAPAELLDALVGEYRLQGAMKMHLRRKGDALESDALESNILEIQAEGQPAFEMGYDDAGDFYPLAFDALLRPRRRPDGGMGFVWTQMGGQMHAERIDARPPTPAPVLSDAQWQEYAGVYPLAPGFELTVRADKDGLHAQASGQSAFPLAPVSRDVFEFAQADIVIRFQRDTDGKVVALALEQGGHTMKGTRK